MHLFFGKESNVKPVYFYYALCTIFILKILSYSTSLHVC